MHLPFPSLPFQKPVTDAAASTSRLQSLRGRVHIARLGAVQQLPVQFLADSARQSIPRGGDDLLGSVGGAVCTWGTKSGAKSRRTESSEARDWRDWTGWWSESSTYSSPPHVLFFLSFLGEVSPPHPGICSSNCCSIFRAARC